MDNFDTCSPGTPRSRAHFLRDFPYFITPGRTVTGGCIARPQELNPTPPPLRRHRGFHSELKWIKLA